MSSFVYCEGSWLFFPELDTCSLIDHMLFSQKSKKHKQEMSHLQDKVQVLEAKEEQLKLERDSVK